MFERILAWYGAIHAIKSISLRYFNAAGAAYGIGERHDPETHAIPLLLDSALGKREPFAVLGVDHPTKDGSCVRDYIHVVDLAQAHVLALGRLRSATPVAEIFNLGTGVGTSVLELIALVEDLLGRRVDYRTAPRRPGDPPVLVASSARAGSMLGWAPSRTIRQTLADALAFHRR
jgi:UDP-glucose 4-epimerase